jgi:hypothetical protein
MKRRLSLVFPHDGERCISFLCGSNVPGKGSPVVALALENLKTLVQQALAIQGQAWIEQCAQNSLGFEIIIRGAE